MDGIPWRAERRQMYERVLDVPRLVSFHNLVEEPAPHPRLKQMRRRLNDTYGGELGEPFTTAGLCLYRDGNDSVAWHGDKIGRSSTEDTMVAIVSLGATRVFALAPTRWRQVAAAAAPARRPVGDGRVVPAHVGARDTEDGSAGRAADQHPVPPARRPLSRCQPFTAATPAVSRSPARWVLTGATGLSGTHQRVGGDDHQEGAEAGDVVVELAGAGFPATVVCMHPVGTQSVHAVDLRCLDDLDEPAHRRPGEADLLAVRRRAR